jgi:hypothetical protein
MACKCQNCGKKYKVDLNIPDELWEQIKPKGKPPGGGLLCGSCIMEKLEKILGHEAFWAEPVHLSKVQKKTSPPIREQPPVRLPDDFEEIELGMSNFDHTIDEGFAEKLKSGKYFGRHAAWDFNGLVYWLKGKFHTDVWVYGSYQESFSADSLEELMELANEEYGSA